MGFGIFKTSWPTVFPTATIITVFEVNLKEHVTLYIFVYIGSHFG